MTDSNQHSDPRTKPILDFLRARQKDEGADPLATAAANALDDLVEQYQALRDLIDGAGWHFDDERLGYIEIQVDREAFIALRPDAFPASVRHGRDCPCTPCKAEDWDAVEAGLS